MTMTRPTAAVELWQLERLAERALTDPAAALDFSLQCTPENLLAALVVKRWDEANPLEDVPPQPLMFDKPEFDYYFKSEKRRWR